MHLNISGSFSKETYLKESSNDDKEKRGWLGEETDFKNVMLASTNGTKKRE